MRIDAHQHFWRIADRAGHWPPPELAVIHRDFGPADLLPLLQAARLDGTVLVQTLSSEADTHYMLGLADEHAFIRGVVGWVDMKSVDAAERIAERARHPKFKGLRPMLQDLPDDDWIDDPQLDAAAEALQAHGLVFDALALPRQLKALTAFARRHPGLPIVIDHAAKPPIASGEWSQWQADMTVLAALPNLHCKLSGLLTEAGAGAAWPQVQPIAETVLALFGAQRLIWGSDWPVLRLAGDYAQWHADCERFISQALPALPAFGRDAALAAVFGGNAARFYRLD